MAESEKMVALKKAYADIILNTAKEAAIRVMASEKKALRSQHDLFAAKDEALRLLVHLKQMIDAKTIEAEILSSSQQTKIDELEAQLQEAESVIVDLRAELKWVHDKLEKVRTNRLNRKIIGDKSCYQDATPGSNIFSPQLGLQPLTISDMNNSLFDQRNLDIRYSNTEQTQHLSVSQFGSPSHDTELASVIIRNKETELLRNGCTQRICAVKKNLLAGKVPPPVEFDENSPKSDMVTKGSNKDHGRYTLPPPMTKNFSGEEVRKHVKVCTSRRIRTHFGKLKAKRRSCPSQLMKPYQPPSILSRCKRHSVNVNAKPDDCSRHSVKTGDVDLKKHLSKMEEKLHCQKSCIVYEKMSIHEREKQWMVQIRDALSTSCTSYPDQHETCLPPSLLSHCKPSSHTLHGNINSGEDQSRVTKNEAKLKPLPRLDPGLTLIKGNLNPMSGSANVTVSVKKLNQSCIIQNIAKGMELADELVNQECETAENTTFPCHASDPEIVNVPLAYSDFKDLKASKEGMVDISLVYSDLEDAKTSKEPTTTSLLDNNRLLKYTFQRKRKKEASNNPDQNTSLEKSTAKRRAGEK